jgi:hypothetical protein
MENFLYVILLFIGLYMFAAVVGTTANYLNSGNQNFVQFQRKTQSFNRFLADWRISARTCKQINDYLKYIWESTNAFDATSILADLPPFLKRAMFLKLFPLHELKFFADLEVGFVPSLAELLTTKYCVPRETILNADSRICQEMYVLQEGITFLIVKGHVI